VKSASGGSSDPSANSTFIVLPEITWPAEGEEKETSANVE